LLDFLPDFLKSDFICEYKIINDLNDHTNLISGVFNNEYNIGQEIPPNSIYLFNLKSFNLFQDNLVNNLAELSDKNITLILHNNDDKTIVNNDVISVLIKYGTKYKISIVYIKSKKNILETTNIILMLINQNYLYELNNTREIYNRFSYLSLKELGLDAIISYFKESIGNDVAVFDIDNKCIASTDKFFDKYFEIKTTAVRKNLYNLYYLTQTIKICNNNLEEEITQIFFPITIHNNVKAYLCVFEIERKLKEIDYFILEVAATATLIEMKKRIAMKTAEERFVNGLIYDLTHNKIDDDGMLLERSKLIGLNTEEKHMVILLEIDNPSNTKVKNPSLKYEYTNDKIFALVSRKIYHKNHYSIIGQLSNTIITLWPLGEDNIQVNLNSIKEIFSNIQAEIIREFKEISIIIGIGKPADNLKTIYKSYREAKDAIILGSTLYSKNAIIGFKDLGILRLISKVEDRNSLIEIIPEQLIELKKHDEKYNAQLLETLSVYLECNGNASKAAQHLYIHYKTILYRLEKINKICNIDLENYYDRLEVEIGLKLLKTLDYDSVHIK